MTDSNRSMFLNVMLVLLAYLLGSVSSAVVVCKVMGLSDPRSHGSKNPGATNVLRLHGKKAATLTLTGDVLKGFVPVFVVYLLNAPLPVLGLAALAAFCGHLFPVFFRFKGGKGVATLIGVLFGINAFLGLAFVVTWLIVALLFRYSSLAGLTASALAPIYCGLLNPTPYLVIPVSIMAVILFWRHRSNIRNLLSGAEDKIGEKNG